MMDRYLLRALLLLLVSQPTVQSPAQLENQYESGFVCATLDWWPPAKCNYAMCPWHSSGAYHINLTELEPYAKPLAPFLLRIGGSLQDHVFYVEDADACPFPTQFPKDPTEHLLQFGWGCVSHTRLLEISDFCKRVGCQIVWGLNAMTGRRQNGTGAWSSTNANEVLSVFHATEAPLYAVTLGNEVWGEMVGLSEEQAIAAFAELSNILNHLWPDATRRPLMAGFDGYVTRRQFPFMSSVLNQLAEQGVYLDALTYHNYPLGRSDDANVVQRVLTPNFGSVRQLGESMTEVARNASIRQTWMSECGGSSNSGSPEATGSFASGFWYLDNMAMLHQMGHQHFCRQTLAGGNYGLLDQLEPRTVHPDYWNAVLYQKLLKQPRQEAVETFGTTTCEGRDHNDGYNEEKPDFGANWYIYSSRQSTAGFTVLGINFSPTKSCRMILKIKPLAVTVYSLTSDTDNGQSPWKSQASCLNGKLLQVVDGKMPELKGETHSGLAELVIEPWTYTFFEIHTDKKELEEGNGAK